MKSKVLFCLSNFAKDKHQTKHMAAPNGNHAWLKLLSSCQGSGVHGRGLVEGRDSLKRLLKAYFFVTRIGQSSKNFCVSHRLSKIRHDEILYGRACLASHDISFPFEEKSGIVRGRANICEFKQGPARSHNRKGKPEINNGHGQAGPNKSQFANQGSIWRVMARLGWMTCEATCSLILPFIWLWLVGLTKPCAKPKSTTVNAFGKPWHLPVPLEAPNGSERVEEYHIVLSTRTMSTCPTQEEWRLCNRASEYIQVWFTARTSCWRSV